MSYDWEQGGSSAASEAAARQLLELRQVSERLGREEGRLEMQALQLQSQIARSEDQAQAARAANSENLLRFSLERISALRAQLASVQEQLTLLRAHKAHLNRQREALESRLYTSRPPQPAMPAQPWRHFGPAAQPGAAPTPTWNPAAQPWELAPPRRRRSRLLFWFGSLGIALIICAALLGVLRLVLFQLPGLGLGRFPTDPSFYQPAGTVPNAARCMAQFGAPCYSPQDIHQAFRLNPLYHDGYTGAGQTIVVLSAGKTDQLQANLQVFDDAWGLPDVNLTILQPFGKPSPYTCPSGEDDLQAETTLDVEWAHAIAPGAKIVVLIGSNNSRLSLQDNCSFWGLDDALLYAIDHHLGNVITISYGGSELGDVADTPGAQAAARRFYQEEHRLFERASQAGITVLAASGDDGATTPNDASNPTSYWSRPNVSWPASDPHVLAVGGTRLSLDPASGAYISEVAWNDELGASGGGLSAVFNEPDYQKALANQALFQGKRGIPDVAFPAEDFLVYDRSQPGSLARNKPDLQHWGLVGGTSISAPCWAGLIAIANQMRGQPLGLVQPALYRLAGKGMHDILTGNNSTHAVKGYQAQTGYDLVTGWGSPIAKDFLPALIDTANQLAGG